MQKRTGFVPLQAKLFALDRDSFQLMLITAENTKKAPKTNVVKSWLYNL